MKASTSKAYKYRIYPTESQITNLLNQFSMCRHLYNWSLEERIKAYDLEQRTITYLEQQNRLPALKEERPWFTSVYSQVLQDVLKRLDKAYQAFFRRVKEGDTPGFPKFKKKGDPYPSRLCNDNCRSIQLNRRDLNYGEENKADQSPFSKIHSREK